MGLIRASKAALSVPFHREQIIGPGRLWLPGSLGLTAKLAAKPLSCGSDLGGEGGGRWMWVSLGHSGEIGILKSTKLQSLCRLPLAARGVCRVHTSASLSWGENSEKG